MATHLLDFGLRYAGFWESAGGGSIKGFFSVAEDDAADGIVSIDELEFWNWEWTGNNAVDPFSISSEDGEAIALTLPGGFSLAEQNTAIGSDFVDPDGLDQGVYASGSGNQIIDLNAIFVEDLAAGTVSEGEATAADGSISVGAIEEFDLTYVGFWEGGGTIEGSFTVIDADAEDGVVSLDELLSWELSWTGNDDVEAFSITSDDGIASVLLPPGGFLLDGTNTPIEADFNDPDGLDQGVYESGDGDQIIDLGALIVEDLANGTFTEGDAAEGSIFVGQFIDFSVQYAGFWNGGGSVVGSFSTTEAAAEDGVVSIEELVSWEWDWTGNDEVDAFSISSEDGEAIALLPPSGFLLEGTNTAFDEEFNDPDGVDQGLYVSGSGDQIIDLGALIIEDLGAGTVAEGTATEGTISVIPLDSDSSLSGQSTIAVSAGETIALADFGGIGLGSKPEQGTIDEVDTLQFTGDGLTAETMQLTQSGSNLEISFLDDATGTLVVLTNFELDKLDNLREETGGNVDRGNILFSDETEFQDSFDIFNADSTQSRLFNRNTVTFLNDLDNTVHGFDESDDVINGLGGDDQIVGLSGNDVLRGDGGDDQLNGGLGDDILSGGEGADSFVLASGEGVDTITDFEVGIDQIELGSGLASRDMSLLDVGSSTLVLVSGSNELLGIVEGVTSLDSTVFA